MLLFVQKSSPTNSGDPVRSALHTSQFPVDLHAYANINAAKSGPERFIWFALLFAATAACIGWSSMTFARYLERQTSTSIEVVFQAKRQPPAVQICGSWLDHDPESFLNISLSDAAMKSLQKMFSSSFGDKNMTLDAVAYNESTNDELHSYIGEPSNWEAIMLRHSVKCGRLLKDCSIGKGVFDCCDERYVQNTMDPHHGKCFVMTGFNSTDAIEMASFMAALRFSIQPFLSTDERNNFINVDFADKFHSPTLSGVVFGMSQTWFIGLKISEYNRMEPNCENRPSGGQCYLARFDSVIHAECNCSFVWPNAWRSQLCTPYVNEVCLKPQLLQISNSVDASVQELCTRQPCHEVVYEIASISSVANGGAAANVIVYYASMSHKKYVETLSFTFDSVVSAIGGNLGLFVGASVITLAQVTVFAFIALRERLLRRLRRASMSLDEVGERSRGELGRRRAHSIE